MPINPVWLRWPSPAAVPRLPWRPIKFGVLFTFRIIFYWDTQKCRITFCSSVDCPAKKKRNRSFEWLEVGALQEDSEETLWENVNFTALEMSGVVRSCVRGLTRRMALPQSQKTTEIPRTRYSSPIVFNAVKNCRRVFFRPSCENPEQTAADREKNRPPHSYSIASSCYIFLRNWISFNAVETSLALGKSYSWRQCLIACGSGQ